MLDKIVVIFFKFLLYALTIILAVCSAGFTVIFYTTGQDEVKTILFGFMAVTFEALKVILAFSYPRIKKNNLKIANGVQNSLNICLILSIAASMYYFMSGSSAPATSVINLLYSQLPFNFGKNILIFLLNMGMVIVIEFWIIKIPSYASAFNNKFIEENDKFVEKTTIQKLVEIPKILSTRYVDNVYKKILNVENGNNCNIEISQDNEGKITKSLGENVKIVANIDSNDNVENTLRTIENTDIGTSREDEKQHCDIEISQDEIPQDNFENSQDNFIFSTLNIENEINLEEYFDKVESSTMFLGICLKIKNEDGFVELKNKEFVSKLGLTDWKLRTFKNELIRDGKIKIENKKIKVLEAV